MSQYGGSPGPKRGNFTWDANGDGVINASDVLMAFDASVDGKLDADELQKIADQLSSQLDYNNTLLQQIQELEQRQLVSQRQLNAAQESAKRNGNASEEMKNELSDTKRKLKMAQEIVETVSKQAKDAQQEAVMHRTEAEKTLQALNETRGMLKDAVDERSRLQRALSNSQVSLSQVRGDAEHVIRQLKEQNDSLKQKQAVVMKEADSFRSRVAPLESEREMLKAKIAELVKSLEVSVKRCDSESQGRSVADKQVRDMAATIDALVAKQNEAQQNYNELKENHESLKYQNEQLEATNAELEEEEQSLRTQCASQQDELDQLSEANQSLQTDVDHLKAEMATLNRNRQLEQQKWVEKLNQMQKENQQYVQQAKGHAEEFAQGAQKHASDAIADRKRTEAKCALLEKEVAELHAMIQNLQGQVSDGQAEWDAQREVLEGTIANYEEQCYVADDALKQAAAAHETERESLMESIKAHKNELIQRGEQFVNSTSIIQLAVRKYRDEALVQRDRVKELTNQVATLQKASAMLKERFAAPIVAYEPEMENAVKLLHAKATESRRQLDESKDNVRKLQMSNEEARSQIIALEEVVSRLEHDKNLLNARIADLQRESEDRVGHHKNRVEQIVREKEDLEERMRKQQTSLESVLSQSRAVQVANQNMQSALTTSSAKFAATKQEYDSRINQLNAEVRRANDERDKQHGNVEVLKGQVKKLMEEVHSWKGKVDQLQQEVTRIEREKESSNAKRSAAAAASGDAVQQYQAQLKQTQEILKVVQAQRAELQQQNEALRAELEGEQGGASP